LTDENVKAALAGRVLAEGLSDRHLLTKSGPAATPNQ